MAYRTYLELCDYFAELPTVLPDLKGVTVGVDEEMLNLQNSRIKYPHLRVETPEVVFMNDDQNGATRYTFRLFVLTNENRKTARAESIALSAMEQVCHRLINQLWADADNDRFDLIAGDKPGDAVRKWSGDNDFGWWFSVSLDLYTDECGAASPTPVEDMGITTPTYAIAVPSGRLLVSVRVKGDTAQTVRLGLVSGTYDLGEIAVAANEPAMFVRCDIEGPATLHLSGLLGENSVKSWLN